MRITINTLKHEIKQTNIILAESGSNVIMEHGARNGYQALDYSIVRDDGSIDYRGTFEVGTSKECLTALYKYSRDYHSKIYHSTKPTRKMAKRVLWSIIDYDRDFFTLSTDQKLALILWAKLTGYKRPSNPIHSLAYYFFQHLIKRVKI